MLHARLCIAGVLLAAAGAAGCEPASPAPRAAGRAPASGPDDVPPPPVFREVAAEAGLDFRHFAGATGEYYSPEITGAGVALLDYDGDGDLDVFLVQGTLLDPASALGDAVPAPAAGHRPGHRLFRNEWIPGGELRFTDVSAEAGVDREGYGMGAAVGDYDNDGDPDLYVTSWGDNVLYRNDGGGRFTDVTAAAGASDPRWSSSASFVDYDLDGDLDLYVAGYLDFTLDNYRPCHGAAGHRDYCSPESYRPIPDKLLRNEGDGTFTDVSVEAGITAASGAGLGVVCADLDGDGWPDIYVADDMDPNLLWINRGDGTFVESGLARGVSHNVDGQPEAGMGVTAGDYDADGDEDLFVTNLNKQTNTLYRNDGAGVFTDVTNQAGLGLASLPATGFGTRWLDFDNDGTLDLFSANGHVFKDESQLASDPFPYRQENQLFRNRGDGRFEVVGEAAGPALGLREVSRGAAFGDLDNDGDVDIVVVNDNGPVRLLRNEIGNRNHWLMLRLRGRASNRDGIGARVAVLRAGRAPLWRRVHTDGSYLSASDVRVHFGLGRDAAIERVVVRWPGGRTEAWTGLPADHLSEIEEGTGEPYQAPRGR